MAKADSRDINEFFFEEGNKVPPYLQQLSKDLYEMFIKGEGTDFTLNAEDNEKVRCHKAILAARSPAFSRILDILEDEDANSFYIRMKKPPLKAMLNYMYSGDLTLIASQDVPLLELYIISHDYELFAMKDFIAPEILPDKPPMATDELHFTLEIVNVESSGLFTTGKSKYLGEKPIPVGTDKFYIGIHVKDGNHSKGYVSVYFRREANREVIHQVLLDVSILDKSGRRNFLRRLDYIFKTDGECELAAFVKKELIVAKKSTFLTGGNLIFSFALEVRFYDSEKNASIFKIADRAKCSRMLMDAYQILSSDLSKLFRSKRYSDVIIFLDSANFTAHKCILAARSMTELNLLRDVIFNLPLEEAESFLLFLYTGDSKYLPEHAEMVHQAASGFILDENEGGVGRLKQFYSDYLSKSLTIGNVLGRLISSGLCKDDSLKHSAIDFIYLNKDTIMPLEKWTIFVAKYQELAVEVENYIKGKQKNTSAP